jgi:hypothetical protein
MSAGLTTPPGRSQQQQLFGLLCSLLKTVQLRLQAVSADRMGQDELVESLVMVAIFSTTAITWAEERKCTASAGAAGGGGTALYTPVDSTADTADSPQQQQQQQQEAEAESIPQLVSSDSDSASALLMVPWMVLFGRCCLTMVQPWFVGHFLQDAEAAELRSWCSVIKSWLQNNSTSAQLAAAGLNPGGILQALQDTITAVQSLRNSSSSDDDAEDASTDAQQQQQQQDQLQGNPSAGGACAASGAEGVVLAGRLHALGVSLSSLPLSWGCNNPLCTNMQGPAEAGIVQGKGHKCKGCCRMGYYCGKACQEQHWKQHKPVCKAVAAAVAGATAVKPKPATGT